MSVYNLQRIEPIQISPFQPMMTQGPVPVSPVKIVQQPATFIQQTPLSTVSTADPKSSPFYYDNTPSGGKVVYYNPKFTGSVRADPEDGEFSENVYSLGSMPEVSHFNTNQYASQGKLKVKRIRSGLTMPNLWNYFG